MNEIVRMIANDLLLPVKNVEHTVAMAPHRARRFSIPKRSGGYRSISQPAVTLKPVLSWLDSQILRHLSVHPIATAFQADKSILDNAEAHRHSRFSVRVDISDFYPAIRDSDLLTVISDTREKLPSWAVSSDALSLVSRVCFDRRGRLPIGYSTSPSIANAVMYKIDASLAEMILREDVFGSAVVTRYADDFVFSTNKAGACRKFVEALANIFSSSTSPKLQINASKTRYMSRAGGSTIITGLRVNNSGNVVVHANYRDHVRLLLKLYKERRLRPDDIPKLVGHLAYVQHVDPALFTKLSFRFHAEIERIRKIDKITT